MPQRVLRQANPDPSARYTETWCFRDKTPPFRSRRPIFGKPEEFLKFFPYLFRSRESCPLSGPMGEQSATRIKGDDYQHLYSWFELLSILDHHSPYDYGFVEHPAAGAADDVTLHSQLRLAPSKYVQVKFHVDQRRQYSSRSLIWTGWGNNRSLLSQLFASWRKLRSHGEDPEIWLVSNWSSTTEMGRFILDSCGLSDDFHRGGLRSEAGKIRKSWHKHLDCPTEQFSPFCKALRLRLGFAGLSELKEKVNDRMGRHGWVTGEGAQALALDTVRSWIKQGGMGKRVDRPSLQARIRERGLSGTLHVRCAAPSLWAHCQIFESGDHPLEQDWADDRQ